MGSNDPNEQRRIHEEDLRRFVSPQFVDLFDRDFYDEFGQYPRESPLYGTTPRNDARRARIQALVTGGATEGERAAAQAALERLDAAYEAQEQASRIESDLQDEADYEDAVMHGEA